MSGTYTGDQLRWESELTLYTTQVIYIRLGLRCYWLCQDSANTEDTTSRDTHGARGGLE